MAGAKLGGTRWFSPWGEASANVLDNLDGDADLGYLGQHAKLTEHGTGIEPLINMGARPYHIGLGRFLTVDPVEGGCANDYTYVFGDPVNQSDLSGRQSCAGGAEWHRRNSDASLRSLGGGLWEFRYNLSPEKIEELEARGAAGVAATTYRYTITAPSGSVIAGGQIGHKVGVPLDYGPHGTFKLGKRGIGTPIPPGSTLTINVVGTLIYDGPSGFTGKYECTF